MSSSGSPDLDQRVYLLALKGGGEVCPLPPSPEVAYRVEFGRTSDQGRRALRVGLDGSALAFLGRQVGAIVVGEPRGRLDAQLGRLGSGAARVDYYADRGALDAAWALVLSVSRRR